MVAYWSKSSLHGKRTTANIIFVYAFALAEKKKMQCTSTTFQKRDKNKERLITAVRREKNVKFADTPSVVVLEILKQQH